jgi:hypothetical protein
MSTDATSGLGQHSVKQLLQHHAAVIEELRARGIIRSKNNPIGDFAETLFSRTFGWTLAPPSVRSYDATDETGWRFQIKARRITPGNSSRQLGAIRNLPDRGFDVLAGVLFAADFSVLRAALIPHAVIEPRSRLSRHVNAWLFHLRDDVWTLDGVQDVTEQVRAVAEGL